ncbi:uncharacterized protein BDR25DRAFT_71121 [Lindgomyces ingoldianus]|uniref:Uncharacterized protein n=1 Tax=Lindgomyces ingoldianus TaxID=673940 RepID=A0ACB6QL36_9PLEO|nr:uncharacterized protein BDR25DRAFT_71121 [Lindgomyces ingoldianus]KAF2466851.1 hypothetical protein BDR25DRAFT_71121 [Lindgomyces ingoldianus]
MPVWYAAKLPFSCFWIAGFFHRSCVQAGFIVTPSLGDSVSFVLIELLEKAGRLQASISCAGSSRVGGCQINAFHFRFPAFHGAFQRASGNRILLLRSLLVLERVGVPWLLGIDIASHGWGVTKNWEGRGEGQR